MQQPQYYKTVRVSEPPKEAGKYIVINDLGYKRILKYEDGAWLDFDENESAWYKVGKNEATHWLEPIPIPDADRLRDVLSRLYKQVMMGAGVSIKMLSETEEALSNTSDGWVRVDSDKPPTNTMVDGYNPAWIDEDYNPEGIRECFLEDEGYWVSAQWNNTHDEWDADDVTAPTHWRQRPSPPQPINP